MSDLTPEQAARCDALDVGCDRGIMPRMVFVKAENHVFKAVELGDLVVKDDGSIWRVACRRGGNGHHGTISIPCAPRRAERKQENGYLRVSTGINKQIHTALAHRVVWRALRGEIPDGLTINHKNGVRDDNRIENLEVLDWVGQTADREKRNGPRARNQETGQWLARDGTSPNTRFLRGAEIHGAKLSDAVVREILHLRASGGVTYQQLADRFGVTEGCIGLIVRGRIWQHIDRAEAILAVKVAQLQEAANGK